MNKIYCDRCKKDLGNFKSYELVNLKINDLKEYATNMEEGIDYNKVLCPSCAIDLMNIIDIECDRYKLITKVEEEIGGIDGHI